MFIRFLALAIVATATFSGCCKKCDDGKMKPAPKAAKNHDMKK